MKGTVDAEDRGRIDNLICSDLRDIGLNSTAIFSVALFSLRIVIKMRTVPMASYDSFNDSSVLPYFRNVSHSPVPNKQILGQTSNYSQKLPLCSWIGPMGIAPH